MLTTEFVHENARPPAPCTRRGPVAVAEATTTPHPALASTTAVIDGVEYELVPGASIDPDLFTPVAMVIDHGSHRSKAAARMATANAPIPVMVWEQADDTWRAVTLRYQGRRR